MSTDEGFVQDKRLPFINPSSLETLRALVQEIQNSGETDPEIWKDCQVRSTKKANVIIRHSSKRTIHSDDIGGEAEVSCCDRWPRVVRWAAGILRFELSLFDRRLPTVACGETFQTPTLSATVKGFF